MLEKLQPPGDVEEDDFAGSEIHRLFFYNRNDKNARAEFVRHYQGTIINAARRYTALAAKVHLEFDDLIQAGNIGLLESMENFDNSSGAPFAAFSIIRIRGAMIDVIREADSIGHRRRRKIGNFIKMREKMRAELMRKPTDEEIVQASHLTHEEILKISGYQSYGNLQSIDQEDVTGHPISRNIPDNRPPAREALEARDYLDAIFNRGIVTDEERDVIKRFRLQDEPHSKIAADRGTTTNYVHKLSSSGMRTLKAWAKAQKQ